jgi:ATP-dependent Zn protease
MGKKTRTVRKQEKTRALAKDIVAEVNRLLEEDTKRASSVWFMRKDVYDHIVSLNKKVDEQEQMMR